VATQLKMPANLAHHHVGKLSELGLLFEQRRESGKVYYQLSAREFRVPSNLLPPGDESGNGRAQMPALSAEFLQAYERSWNKMQTGQEDMYGFGDTLYPATQDTLPESISREPYPTHADMLTLRLNPERFAQLANALSKLLDEAQAEGHGEGNACTFAVLAFAASDQTEGRMFQPHDRQ